MNEPKKTDFRPKWADRGEEYPDEPAVLCGSNPELPDTAGCVINRETCIKTWSGKYVDLLNPTAAMVDLGDISHALHNLCRYTGHTNQFYSVAEHCVLAAGLALEEGCTSEEIRAVLMHDANEAYLSDTSRPLKVLMRSLGVTAYDDLSKKWDAAIGERFGIDFEKHHSLIKVFDHQMMLAEKHRFWPHDEEEWACLDGAKKTDVCWIGCKPEDSYFFMAAVWNGIR